MNSPFVWVSDWLKHSWPPVPGSWVTSSSEVLPPNDHVQKVTFLILKGQALWTQSHWWYIFAYAVLNLLAVLYRSKRQTMKIVQPLICQNDTLYSPDRQFLGFSANQRSNEAVAPRDQISSRWTISPEKDKNARQQIVFEQISTSIYQAGHSPSSFTHLHWSLKFDNPTNAVLCNGWTVVIWT